MGNYWNRDQPEKMMEYQRMIDNYKIVDQLLETRVIQTMKENKTIVNADYYCKEMVAIDHYLSS